MFTLSRILMPIDFSERCIGGVRYAIPLAERFQSELTLLQTEAMELIHLWANFLFHIEQR